mmetsp:Transcript_41809/g.61385  ORF Transcript_41809/g.61385 Transcript_41809/m.61385 type:complete len:776 (-) Transcript_41809:270-2597(-)|eukprot:CAMPEP_0195526386 /NCGR_PEP_ID=MMETSP0794_2-20130614/27424_1 /TAXON_ID=515487 /ORGANISM="Stephanopyxis turris, Strain CCMP 815" /LENGTH=775 /DNA_ID=CAMNT_0040657059 /DNA_START=152 /DNA_END=2479 /DNA_ORIENTATION=-
MQDNIHTPIPRTHQRNFTLRQRPLAVINNRRFSQYDEKTEEPPCDRAMSKLRSVMNSILEASSSMRRGGGSLISFWDFNRLLFLLVGCCLFISFLTSRRVVEKYDVDERSDSHGRLRIRSAEQEQLFAMQYAKDAVDLTDKWSNSDPFGHRVEDDENNAEKRAAQPLYQKESDSAMEKDKAAPEADAGDSETNGGGNPANDHLAKGRNQYQKDMMALKQREEDQQQQPSVLTPMAAEANFVPEVLDEEEEGKVTQGRGAPSSPITILGSSAPMEGNIQPQASSLTPLATEANSGSKVLPNVEGRGKSQGRDAPAHVSPSIKLESAKSREDALPTTASSLAKVLFDLTKKVPGPQDPVSGASAKATPQAQPEGTVIAATPSKEEAKLEPPSQDYTPDNPKETIAYVITLLECKKEPLHDGAAILARTVMLNSISNPDSGSKYEAKLIAIMHTDAKQCAPIYTKLGYEVLIRNNPVQEKDIADGFFKNNANKLGFLKEYVKLYAYTLTDYKIVVHMDFNTMVLKPLDELYDAMLESWFNVKEPISDSLQRHIQYHKNTANETLPTTIKAFFTRDYTIDDPKKKHKGMQRGLLVFHPSKFAFKELVDVVKSGKFYRQTGWENKGHGGYLNSMGTKGLLSFYYDYRQPHTAVELNRCFYNSISDTPRTRNKYGNMVCKDGRPECMDCRTAQLADIKTANLSICRQPWSCFWHDPKHTNFQLCRDMTRHWFLQREELEEVWVENIEGYSPPERKGAYATFELNGYCKTGGDEGYIPMVLP